MSDLADSVAVRPAAAHDNTREVRVFISSTFWDLGAAREHILKKVFPQLRQTCRDRGLELTEIDLRWGITEEEAYQGKIIRLCLDEIDRCRPFFVGILGQRYGWVPKAADLALDPELVADHPWLREAAATGCSITEIEIRHAVLRDVPPRSGSQFYFVDPRRSARFGSIDDSGRRGAAEDRADQDPTAHARLRALKRAIRRSGARVRDDCRDVEALGRCIHDDLIAAIEAVYPTDQAPSPLERDRRGHEAFAAVRRRAYVADAGSLARLDEHVGGEGPPLVVTGESGVGKSALLAYWSLHQRQAAPNTFLISHFVGATSTDTDHLGLLRRVMAEIRAQFALPEELPSDREQIEASFPGWLSRTRGERFVLILDALNQLDGQSANLAWLPGHLPPNVRLIVSAAPSPALDALRRNGWPELIIRPLEPTQREVLIHRYLRTFGKALGDQDRRRIAGDGKCANPLFLRTVLEELRIFGRFDQLKDRIDHYLAASDLGDLFQRVLHRMEQDYGERVLREVMSLIWAARRGLSETELVAAAGLTRLELSTLLPALDYHLMRRGGLLDFFHAHLTRAVEQRYVPTAVLQTAAHRRLADFFADAGATAAQDRRVDELPWQLQRVAAWERLRDFLKDLPNFFSLHREERKYELLGYWLALRERYDMVKSYRESLAAEVARGVAPLRLSSILNEVAVFFFTAGRYEAAEPLYRQSLTLREQVLGAQHPETAGSLHNLASLLDDRGDYDGAEMLYCRALEIRRTALGPEHPDTAETINNLALTLDNKGDYEAAARLYRQALTIREAALGPEHPFTAQSYNNLATLLCEMGDFEAAEPLYRRALKIREKALGPHDPDTAQSLNNLATLLYRVGNYEAAEPLFRRDLAISEQVLGPDHPDTAISLNNLGLLNNARGDPAAAEPFLRRALTIREKSLGRDHMLTAVTAFNLALALAGRGEPAAAEPLFRRAMASWETTLEPDHPYMARGWHGMADVRRAGGDFAAAEALLRRALELRERVLGSAHPETAESLQALAGLLDARGALAEAETALRRAIIIQERAFGPHHPRIVVSLSQIAVLLRKRGDAKACAEAEELLWRALGEMERVFGPDHPETHKVHDLLHDRTKGNLLRRSSAPLSLLLRSEHASLADRPGPEPRG